MAKLYIANCTKQVQDFLFKIPEQTVINPYKVSIPIGGQALIYKDTTHDILDFIVEQHLKYGLLPVSEIDRSKDFIGMCFQFDKPIDVDKIKIAMSHNDNQAELRSYEQRKIAAMALSNRIDETLVGSEDKLNSIEMEITEQRKGPADNEPKMVEAIQVAKPGSKAAARGAERAQHRGG